MTVAPCRWLHPMLLAGMLVACGQPDNPLDSIRASGELHFATRNSPSTYYLDRDGPTGFEYDLALGFAQALGVELVVHQTFTLEELFAKLQREEASIAGAGLSLTEQRLRQYASSVPYASQQPLVVYKAGERKPRQLEDLEGLSIAVMANSSHSEILQNLKSQGHSWLNWESVDTSDPMELLVRVRDDVLDVAVVDSRDFRLQQNLVPRLDRAFELGGERDIVWFMHRSNAGSGLQEAIDAYLQEQHDSGRLAVLARRHFYRDSEIRRIDSQTFVRRISEDLNDYRGLIERVANEYQLPWEFLAAMSYQESHWDPDARSRTGVRGMMMLTRPTARELGVKNRTDPLQSLAGGARYYKDLLRRLPDDIQDPDRSYMALAAYNIGMAHLEDARVLTQRQGGNPHLWRDVMEHLPLLENGEYYRTLRHGYARGQEAVRYVQNIRHYYNILRWQSARAARPRPPVNSDEYLPETLRGLRLLAL